MNPHKFLALLAALLLTACNPFGVTTPVPASPLATATPLVIESTPIARFPIDSKEDVAFAWSPNGTVFALAQLQHGITLYKTQTFQPLWSTSFDKPMVSGDLTFSPDGQWLASAHTDNLVRIWNNATGQLYREISTQYQTGNVAFTPDSTLLATGELDIAFFGSGPGRPGRVQIWEVKTGQLLATLDGKTSNAPDVYFPNNQTLANYWQIFDSDGRGHPGKIQIMRLVNSGTEVELQLLREQDNRWGMKDVQVSPNGQELMAVMLDTTMGNMHLVSWETQTGQELFTSPTTPDWDFILGLYPVPGQNIAAGWWNESLHFLDMRTGREVKAWPFQLPEGDVHGRFAFFSPTGQVLAREVVSYNDPFDLATKVELFDAGTGKMMATLDQARLSLASKNSPFNPVTGWLAARSSDGAIQIWAGIP